MVNGAMDLGGIEMASESGLHLISGRACGADARAIAVGGLIAFDYRDAPESRATSDRGSNSAVFPAPGVPIILTAKIPRCSK